MILPMWRAARLWATLAVLATLAMPAVPDAQPAPNPAAPDPAAVIEDATPLPVEIAGHAYALDTLVVRRPGADRLPVVLITHGANPGNPRGANMTWLRGWAHDLAHRGWLAVAVMRRGYGRSEGEVADDSGTCALPDVGRYFDANADDLQAALRAVARRGDADMGRVLLLGDSAGGAAVLDLAARMPGGIAAVVNVSGGLTRDDPFRPRPGCDAFLSDMVWNFARFGATAHMPTLWLYAENDGLFRPGLVSRMHAAFTGAGGQAELHTLPPFGADGHAMFYADGGPERLLPALDAFLRMHGLPSWDEAVMEPLLARLSPADRLAAERYFREAPAEKAMALGPSGGVYWFKDSPTLESARADALAYCRKEAGGECRLAAENFHLVPPP